MQTSIFLARLLGPLFLVPGIGILLNPRIFRSIGTEVVHSVTLIYLFGLVDLAAGLAVVLTHNVWVASWRVLITLFGWAMLVRGVLRIVAPNTVMGFAAKYVGNKQLYQVVGAAAVIIGLVLCYFGYSA